MVAIVLFKDMIIPRAVNSVDSALAVGGMCKNSSS